MTTAFVPVLPASRHLVSCAPLLLVLVCAACSEQSATLPSKANAGETIADAAAKSDAAALPADASEQPTEQPDYAAAFPQERVARLDITISSGDWQTMVDDMTESLGAFGAGGGARPGGSGPPGMGDMAGGPPTELSAACKELSAGEACRASFQGMETAGTCSSLGGTLFCLSEGGPGGGMGGFMGGGSADLISETPVYVECDVSSGSRAWQHVGIRFKGNSSLAMPWRAGVWKLPLRLKFDHFEQEHPEVKNQRFYGFKNLSLSNSSMDQSLLRDKLGTEVFVSAGIAAPETAFYRVYIDHGEGPTYFGLYTAIELPSDKAFLETHFMDDDGNLYKPDGTGATFASWVEASLEKENNESVADYTDVRAMFDALHADRTDSATWRTGLEAHFDVDTFLHWLALNTVIQDWDHYGRMSHNYYLYANPRSDGKLQWIPWDHSFAFTSTASGGLRDSPSLGLSEITEAWPLIRFLLDDPVYHAKYEEYVARAADFDYTPSKFEARFREAHALIAPYVTGQEGEQPGYTFISSPSAFEQSTEELVAHVKQRQVDVATYFGRASD